MSRKREPVAEIGAEDYRIVKHTHDVEQAAKLIRAALLAEHGCPGDGNFTDFCADDHDPHCPHRVTTGTPRQVYVRIQGALPNSYAAAEGWSYAYHEVSGPARGAFPAVVFQ